MNSQAQCTRLVFVVMRHKEDTLHKNILKVCSAKLTAFLAISRFTLKLPVAATAQTPDSGQQSQ